MTPVTTIDILDRLSAACDRYRIYGDRGIDDVFFALSGAERVAFDLFLVKMDDELAYQAGTVEHRFRTRVRRMLKLEGLLAN